MPKSLKSSRWFTFSCPLLSDIRDWLKMCGSCGSQWFVDECVMKGYIQFKRSRPVPFKKCWLPGAQVELATQSDIKSLYDTVPFESWFNYGVDPVFVLKVVIEIPSISIADSMAAYAASLVPVPKPKSVVVPPPSEFFPDVPVPAPAYTVRMVVTHNPTALNLDDYEDDPCPFYLAADGRQYPGSWYAAIAGIAGDAAELFQDLTPREQSFFSKLLSIVKPDIKLVEGDSP